MTIALGVLLALTSLGLIMLAGSRQKLAAQLAALNTKYGALIDQEAQLKLLTDQQDALNQALTQGATTKDQLDASLSALGAKTREAQAKLDALDQEIARSESVKEHEARIKRLKREGDVADTRLRGLLAEINEVGAIGMLKQQRELLTRDIQALTADVARPRDQAARSAQSLAPARDQRAGRGRAAAIFWPL